MSAALDPPPTTLQTLVAIADDLRRVQRRVAQAQQVSAFIQYDHHRDALERSAIIVVTCEGRVASSWRYLIDQLVQAESELDDIVLELDGLSDTLGNEAAP
jgi:hypothetical protein